ncbi:tyrosine-protein kinase [Streptococcus plurextorum]|uniref:tyrosine-protein kinase n=1 Tax=Streptococcus plurextorum TaxID=456876 RepID=UPI000410180E|nr:tyrosine-protein kinase [Streptococcus plurextorum]
MAILELVKSKQKLYQDVEEYCNSIRTNIQFSGQNIRAIALTSVQPGEGKSTTSTNLAISFARAGFKTLLVDADIRNSVLTGTFKAQSKVVGLTNFLSGNAYLSEAICETNVQNLFVIPAGKFAPNPTTLLQNENFANMFDALREHYDYIIVDTAPIGLVIDAAIVAQRCDGVVLVTEAGAIKRKFIQKAKDQMEQSGAAFLGVILNKVDNQLDRYGAYGSYGNYGDYGQAKSGRKRK